MTKLTQEHRDLEERLKEEKRQKEQFKNTKNEIEEERRLLDRTVEKLQREVRHKEHAPYNLSVKFSESVFYNYYPYTVIIKHFSLSSQELI